MINRLFLLVLIIAASLVGSPASSQAPESTRGSQILYQYRKDLQDTLRVAMNQGVVEAVEACRIQAPEVADSWSQGGVRVGRASHRLRNPRNVPPDWVEPILNAYIASAADRGPRTVELQGGRLGYVEPIVLQPLCTACHGESISSEVSAKILKHYPEDEAVGFKVGDLRGVFWVEYSASE